MKDSRKPTFQPQVKKLRRLEFELEPVVARLLKEKACDSRMAAMLAVTATCLNLFPHWVIREAPGRGLYAIVQNPKAYARQKRGG